MRSDDFSFGTVKLEARKFPLFLISCHDYEKYSVSSVIFAEVSTCKMCGEKKQYFIYQIFHYAANKM